ncbi:MAG: glycosyltransferase [Phycisphaerales bacterium]|nr:glycosyltransferase [Phycisphaerales bacterium]
MRTVATVPRLAPDPSIELTEGVSVICPARDEGDEIEAAMGTRLSDASPQLEFIAVDDRSDDDTGAILEALAQEDSRLQVLHLEDCPEGWLGKVHAQQRGVDLATHDWLLFSDGDTHVEPGTVAVAQAWAIEQRADIVAFTPRIVDGPWMLRAGVTALMRMLLGGLKLWEANRDDRPRVMGVGAFNLVRRAALERAGGLEQLRMEVADDVGLAQIVVDAGGRARLATCPDGVWIRWYRTLRDLLRGTEKGCAKAGSRAKLMLGLAMWWLLLVLELAPFVLWAWWPIAPAIIAASTGLVAVALCLSVALRFSLPRGWALLVPVSTLVTAAILLRSLVLAIVRGGIRWKGDAHTLAAARAGEKVQL